MARAKAKTEEELAEAIRAGADYIEVEGDLAKKTFKIRATGKVAWVIAFGCIGVAVTAALLAAKSDNTKSSVTAGIASLGAAAVPAFTLGPAVMATAIAIAMSAGGVAVLTQLRDYKQVSYDGGVLVLSRT
ncbi:hypothetical protein [Pseudomonas sp. LFM046]|uniref:hypothetical protein n=1 Tax=Pseudomonas sp. LFM046 TaxID=1608357 RepID=UPI0005CFCDD0|nr:hypothetical protein [Pseudomonas sp. LFM046]